MKLLYSPCSSADEAKTIGKTLVSEKLASCVNTFPTSSLYFWEGKLEENSEYALLLKVLDEKIDDCKKRLKELHSYDVPFIGVLSVDVNSEYEEWAKGSQ